MSGVPCEGVVSIAWPDGFFYIQLQIFENRKLGLDIHQVTIPHNSQLIPLKSTALDKIFVHFSQIRSGKVKKSARIQWRGVSPGSFL